MPITPEDFVIGDTPEDVHTSLQTSPRDFRLLGREEALLLNKQILLENAIQNVGDRLYMKFRSELNPKTGKPCSEEDAKRLARMDTRVQELQDKLRLVKVNLKFKERELSAMQMRYGASRTLRQTGFSEELAES